MDHGVYDIDFTREGRRRVYLFSYLLGYSRRQYLRFVESMDLPTTLREHVRAFHHLGGVARVCLYDNFKAVVLRHDADGAWYNPKFLAFATHYSFRPQACRVRRPQTKGKVERKMFYVETNLLNGRTFDTLEHLNEVTAWWLQSVADVRVLRDFKESPLQRHQREQPDLLPLPTSDFDTALVVYRHVNVEGFIAYRLNFYSVPWSYIGQVLPVRVIADEVIIYSIGLEEIARHRRVSSTQSGVRQLTKSHHPQDDPGQRTLLLQQRFGELGPIAVKFLDGLLAKQIQGKLQAQQLLALVAHYQRDDVLKALERAVRFGAFSLAAMRRILAAQAKPRPLWTNLPNCTRTRWIRACVKNRSVHARPAIISIYSYPRNQRMKRRSKKSPKTNPPTPNLREQILADFTTLRVPVTADQLDETLKQAQDAGWSHLEFLHRLVADQAGLRRQRRIERLIKDARFREALPLSSFDWNFNPESPRLKIEALAQGDFIRRKQNVVFVGQSGLGKSRLIQSIGLAACMLEQRVRYITSGALLQDLTAALADQTIHNRVRFYAKFSLLIIDEFGFDRSERAVCPEAASLWYKIIDARSQRSSTALVTNIDFESWAEYLGDAPLAMAMLDRVVDGATIVKLKGKSYRLHRGGAGPTHK